MKILCCGIFPALQRTLEFAAFKPGAVNRVRSVTLSVGGKATNAARVLKTLGADPLLFGFAGGDAGAAVKRLLDAENIPHRFTETKTETRICQTLLSDDAADFTELAEDASPLPARDWKALVKAFREIAADFDLVLFSGTLPHHAPEDIYAELIAAAGPSRVILDTSGAPLLAALEQRPALVKINATELRHTFNAKNETAELARELIAQGAGAAGITRGKDPALLVTPARSATHSVAGGPHSTLNFHVPDVEVVSTLGCGDAVNAGIAFALAKGRPLKEAFVFGLACGASNAMNRLPGVVKPDQIAALVPRIKIL